MFFFCYICRCTQGCLRKIGEDGCTDIFSKFYDIPSKNEQDLVLQGQIDAMEVHRRRPSMVDEEFRRAQRVGAFKYHVVHGSKRIEVCFEAFKSVYDISEKKIRRIRNLKLKGERPVDKRGKGITNTLPLETHELVKNHIKSFPLKESHYCGKKVYYMSSDLSIKKMWRLFSQKNPTVKVSNYFYWLTYRENFNHRFGRPQVDTCAVCEELNVKIKAPHLNVTAKRVAVAELMVHKRKSKIFYNKLEEEREINDPHVLALAFDFMKTVSLPKIPVQDLYYLRQLSLNVFSINDIKKTKVPYFYTMKGTEEKGQMRCAHL